jgi:putative sigma-54 modulation protein
MQVTVTGRHMGVSEPLKDYCRGKAEKLARLFDRVVSVQVILDGRDGRHSAEMIVHADRTAPFVAVEAHDDAYAAFDLVLDKIERQLRRHKERLRNRKHPQLPPEQTGGPDRGQ